MRSARAYHAAANWANDTAVITGGTSTCSSCTGHATSEVYNGTHFYTGPPDLPYNIWGHCMGYFPDTDMLIVNGGYTNGRKSSDTLIYTQDSDVWSAGTSMNRGRALHACSVYQDELWVGGSWGEDTTTEVYTPGTESWRDGP